MQHEGLGFDGVGAGQIAASCDDEGFLARSSRTSTALPRSLARSLTVSCHGPQLRFVRHIVHGRPRRDVEHFTLRDCVVLKQRLHVLPARQLAHIAHRGRHDVVQAVPRAVAKDRALHVRRHELAPAHGDLAGVADDALRDVQRVVVVFGEAQRDGDLVLARAGLDRFHLRGVDGEGVLDVARGERRVHASGPAEREDMVNL